MGRTDASLPDLSPSPPLPGSVNPGLATRSLVLTHTVCLLARPRSLCGTSWKVTCFPSGGNARFERGLHAWSASFLPSSGLPSVLEASQNFYAQSQPGREAPISSSAPSLASTQPRYHLGYGNWLHLIQLWAAYPTAPPSLDPRQVLG